ncbi:hypothetical protein [Nocardioides iriomotensis]|uniref:Uncharacterized protein n=1 Tax=Nocardioides iriomotensis TaxID=715784 RepID=A0A4Q5J7X0_9ACTN|nr:hypothetical protein [Nocardioides iriomotensis]RYU14802.1 hypothetical protein ETU37_02095 [Nocardioides iriomotensis]
MTYGEHRDRTYSALSWLLSNGAPTSDSDRAELLAYRGAVVAAAHQLSYRAVHGADPLLRSYPPRQRVDLRRVVISAPIVLVGELAGYPRLTPEASALMDALSRTTTSPHLRAWAEAARHWTVAAETLLDRSEWTGNPSQAWSVIADVADVSEALSLLDRDLVPLASREASSSVDFWERNDRLRLMSRYVATLAESGQNDDAVAHLDRRSRSTRTLAVSRPRDLEAALERLVEVVERRPFSAAELRSFALAQAVFARRCGDLVNPTHETLVESLSRRFDAYRMLAASTARVGSINRPGGMAALAQLNEIALGVSRFARTEPLAVTGQIAALEPHQAAIGRALGRSVVHAVANGSYLVLDESATEVAWRRVSPTESPRIVSASSDLAQKSAMDLGFASKRVEAVGGVEPDPMSTAAERQTSVLRRRLNEQGFRRSSAPNRTLRA